MLVDLGFQSLGLGNFNRHFHSSKPGLPPAHPVPQAFPFPALGLLPEFTDAFSGPHSLLLMPDPLSSAFFTFSRAALSKQSSFKLSTLKKVKNENHTRGPRSSIICTLKFKAFGLAFQASCDSAPCYVDGFLPGPAPHVLLGLPVCLPERPVPTTPDSALQSEQPRTSVPGLRMGAQGWRGEWKGLVPALGTVVCRACLGHLSPSGGTPRTATLCSGR